MLKRFSEFTADEQKIICEKNRDCMMYDDWYYDVARDMSEFAILDDYVLDWVADDETCGQLGIIEYEKDGEWYSGRDDEFGFLSELERRLNEEVHEYYDYLRSPEYIAEGLADDDELIDAETYQVIYNNYNYFAKGGRA